MIIYIYIYIGLDVKYRNNRKLVNTILYIDDQI